MRKDPVTAPRLQWRRESDGSDAPGHERFVSIDPAHGSPDDRYIVARPASVSAGNDDGFVALREGMHACTESEACFDFRQEVCPRRFPTRELAEEACEIHALRGEWPRISEVTETRP